MIRSKYNSAVMSRAALRVEERQQGIEPHNGDEFCPQQPQPPSPPNAKTRDRGCTKPGFPSAKISRYLCSPWEIPGKERAASCTPPLSCDYVFCLSLVSLAPPNMYEAKFLKRKKTKQKPPSKKRTPKTPTLPSWKSRGKIIFIGICVANPSLLTVFHSVFLAGSFCFALTFRLESCINHTWWCQWDHCIHECPGSSALPAVMTFQPWVWHWYLFQRQWGMLLHACG